MHRIIMDAVSAQSAEMLGREAGVRPHASTWLNQQRWNDEADPEQIEKPMKRAPRFDREAEFLKNLEDME